MTAHITLGDLSLDVQFKNIKNVHLSVHPPHGRITVSAPYRMDLDAIRVFAVTKIDWIRRQQRKYQGQARETRREFLDNESHFLWGKRYRLKNAASKRPGVEVEHDHIIINVRDDASVEHKDAIVARWYREEVQEAANALVKAWAPAVGVELRAVKVRRMKTKWGSCSRASNSIWLNTELAKKPKECLEYVLVHELVHFLEPSHNQRFAAAMDRLMPNWRLRRDLLNELPVGYEWLAHGNS